MIEYVYYEDLDGSSLFTTKDNAELSMERGLLDKSARLILSFEMSPTSNWGEAKRKLYELTGDNLGHFEDNDVYNALV